MTTMDEAITVLREHVAVCEDLLRVEQCEQALAVGPGEFDLRSQRESTLQHLNHSLAALKELRRSGMSLRDHAVAGGLLRAAQELILKVVTLGRENERARLVRGLVPPKHLPSVQRDRPHFVAELYRRNGA